MIAAIKFPVRPKKRLSNGKPGFLDNPRLPYLVSFFVPILVMLIVFAGNSIFPFGNRSFLRTDLYHQYAPFFQEYKDKLSSLDSLYYTWDIGLGTNFMALYAYYLSSPLNWLLILCPRSLVIEFITYGIVLRMALSSLALTYYLNKHNNTNSLGAAFFGIFYGLSGYMAAYSWNIMWLDCLVLFPLIVLGLERLIKENRCLLYCLTLALCIYSNYYISIMICISLVLLFAVKLILYRGEDTNYPLKVLNFALYSLLAGGLAAVMLIPEISALSTTASGSFSFPDKWNSYFSIFDMLSRHLIDTTVEIGLDHWPNIYCGIAVLLFFPLYLMNRKIPFREKIAYGLLLLFFLLSFSTNKLNFIWHGFHYPNSLPCRQSFIYIFLVLALCYQGYLGLKQRTAKDILKCLCFAAAFVILAEKLGAEYTSDTAGKDGYYYIWYSFYLSLAFLLYYAGLLRVRVTGRKKWRGLLFAGALAGVLVESSLNMAYTSVTTVSRTDYVKDDEAVRNISALLEEENAGDFFRTEKLTGTRRTKNDGAWLDYRSASIFSSTAYADLTAFYKKLGLESSTNAYGTVNGLSWPACMLLGIRYCFSSSLLTDNEFQSLKYSASTEQPETIHDADSASATDNLYFYENTYALPLAFLVDSNLASDWDTSGVNPADNWNSLAHALGIEEDLFVAQDFITGNDTATVSVSTSDTGCVYLYVNKTGPSKVKVTYGSYSKEFSNLSRSYFIALDSIDAGTSITVTNTDSNKSGQGLNLSAYVLNGDVLKQMYEILNKAPLSIGSYTSTSVSGTVTSAKGGTMFTSIPYDTGWTVYVDGSAVDIEAFEDAFISFAVPAGSHTIEMKYTPNGFWMGLTISLISTILLVMILLLKRQWKISQERAKLEEAAAHDGENDPDGGDALEYDDALEYGASEDEDAAYDEVPDKVPDGDSFAPADTPQKQTRTGKTDTPAHAFGGRLTRRFAEKRNHTDSEHTTDEINEEDF